MAEERIECFTFTVKKDVYDHAVTLSGERKIGNVKVFLTKEMMKYAKRISKTREHANEPLPRKLNSQTNENVKVSLMLSKAIRRWYCLVMLF